MKRMNRLLVFPGIGLILVLTACGGGGSTAAVTGGTVPIATSANSVATTVATATVAASTQ